MKLLFIVNTPDFFLSHRVQLALAARNAGYSVEIATGPGKTSEEIKELGFVHHSLPLTRSGTRPWSELIGLIAVWRLISNTKPDLLHLVTIKPALYGGLVARLVRVPAVVLAVSGLGSVFVAANDRGKQKWLTRFVKLAYKFVLAHPNLITIFQNPDDMAVMRKISEINLNKTLLIRGSGVQLEKYPSSPEPKNVPVVTFASRLLKEKGVEDFIDAAKILRCRGNIIRFWLVGAPDPGNPSSVSHQELMSWHDEGIVEYLGFRKDIHHIFSNSNIVVLPSFYAEGLPKVLIEAAACGRAVITTDMPGCRDAIQPGISGLLVPARNPSKLADAIERLSLETEERMSMGREGRKLAEKEFSIEKVIDAHLKVYSRLSSE